MAEQRYVIIRGEVFTWEEKEPFQSSGHSVAGALEYRPEDDTLRCHECGEWYVKLSSHIAMGHSARVRDYRRQHFLQLGTALMAPRARAKQSKTIKDNPAFVGAAKRGLARMRELCADPEWWAWYCSRHKEARGATNMEMQNENNRCPAQAILKVQQLAAELGRIPAVADDPALSNMLIGRFGSFYKGLEAAGFTPTREIYSKTILREALIDFYVRNGRVPMFKDFGHGGRLASTTIYTKNYGSIRDALVDAGLALVATSPAEFQRRIPKMQIFLTARAGAGKTRRDSASKGAAPRRPRGRPIFRPEPDDTKPATLQESR